MPRPPTADALMALPVPLDWLERREAIRNLEGALGEPKKAAGITTAATLFSTGSQLYRKYGGSGSPSSSNRYIDPDGFYDY